MFEKDTYHNYIKKELNYQHARFFHARKILKIMDKVYNKYYKLYSVNPPLPKISNHLYNELSLFWHNYTNNYSLYVVIPKKEICYGTFAMDDIGYTFSNNSKKIIDYIVYNLREMITND